MINRAPPYAKAAAILAAGALIGVGAAKLDIAGLNDKPSDPPDRKPSFKPNSDTQEMPLPAFGDAPLEEKEGITPLARNDSAIGEFRVEQSAPKSDRPSLLASSSERAIVATSGVSRPLPDLVESKSDAAPVVAEKQYDPLPSPAFGQAFAGEETANQEPGFVDSTPGRLADAQSTKEPRSASKNSFDSQSGTNGNYQAQTPRLAQAQEASSNATPVPKPNASNNQLASFETPVAPKTDRLVPAGSTEFLKTTDDGTSAVAAANNASVRKATSQAQSTSVTSKAARQSSNQSGVASSRPTSPASGSNTKIASFTAPKVQSGQSTPSAAAATPPRQAKQQVATAPASFAPQQTASIDTRFTEPQNITYSAASTAADGRSAELSGEPKKSYFGVGGDTPIFSEQDELILDLKVKGAATGDTVLGYNTEDGLYLPFGTLTRILDLAVPVSDDGHFAEGWTLDEQRTLTLDLRNNKVVLEGKEHPLRADAAAAFGGEMFVSTGLIEQILPVDLKVDLSQLLVTIETREPFPFEERLAREAQRAKLAVQQENSGQVEWPRVDTPYKVAAVPIADVEARAISDTARGERVEGNIRFAGDLAFLTTEAFLTADTRFGVTNALLKAGRTDPDAELLGPLEATSFSFGDVSTNSLPIGVRGVAGRGVTLTNTPIETASVFENIDFRGVLPIGYEVELYRNNILIGSTTQSNNGQYEFLQVPVDFGLNEFRIVFYGPQGQRREEVRRINVGDGRVKPGQFVYRLGAAQKDQNLLGVRDPFFIRGDDFGDWRISGELSYGISSDVTAVASGAWFQTPEEDRWLVSGGIRSGVGQVSLKSDIAFSDNDAFAIGAGIGGRFGNSSFRLDHVEYSGDFIDETKAVGRESLRRSTQLDLNTTLKLGDPDTGLVVPITARARHYETIEGRKQTNAALRASTQTSGVLISNTLEYQRIDFPGLDAKSELFGNFDLTNLSDSKLRTRATTRYELHPNPDLVSMSLEADYTIDEKTLARAQFGYAFENDSAVVGGSIIREFDRFSLALNSNYRFVDESYSVGLRIAASFGHDPKRNKFFVTRPGAASHGAASLRAFQDLDGDSVFGPADRALPEVDFTAYNQSAKTDKDGLARLDHLGNGRPVALRVDTSTLPDIGLAPVNEGIEIVPRAGTIHSGDFAIVALSEIEGTARFSHENGARGVSGVRLQLLNAEDEVVSHTRTEVDGYYFFEQVKPGNYKVVVDEDQAERLSLCLAGSNNVIVGYESDIYKQDLKITSCDDPLPQPAFGQAIAITSTRDPFAIDTPIGR